MTQPAPAARRPLGFGRGVSVVALALLACSAAPAVAASPSPSKAPASQPLVALLQDHVARTSPHSEARALEVVQSLRPLTRVRTVLPVLARTDADGYSWVKVRLPGRPNGHSGWIRSWQTRSTSTPWRIAIRVSSRRVTVLHRGRVVRRFRAVVGAPSTPTPRGNFFVEEAMAFAPGTPGGPYAFATSARSRVLLQFAGGPGQIGLHGTRNLWGPLGSAASHGCIRISPAAITWMVRRIGAGVPMNITR